MAYLNRGWTVFGPDPAAPSASSRSRRTAATPSAAASVSAVAVPAAPTRAAAPRPAPAAAVPAGYQLVPVGAAPQPYAPPAGYQLTPIAPQPAAVAPVPAPASPQLDRIRSIMNHPEAVGREDMAKHLALETGLDPAAAVAHLAAAPRGASSSIASGAAGAAVARQALGLPPDPVADLAVATGVAAALVNPMTADAAASAKFQADLAEGERVARWLTGR